MAAVTPGGGNHHHGRTPTMNFRPAAWATASLGWATINAIVALDTVIPGGAGQAWAAAIITAVAGAFGLLLLRSMQEAKQVVGFYTKLLEDERHAHGETRVELRDTQQELQHTRDDLGHTRQRLDEALHRISQLERKVDQIGRE